MFYIYIIYIYIYIRFKFYNKNRPTNIFSDVISEAGNLSENKCKYVFPKSTYVLTEAVT